MVTVVVGGSAKAARASGMDIKYAVYFFLSVAFRIEMRNSCTGLHYLAMVPTKEKCVSFSLSPSNPSRTEFSSGSHW
jgi:hypothetical protein